MDATWVSPAALTASSTRTNTGSMAAAAGRRT